MSVNTRRNNFFSIFTLNPPFFYVSSASRSTFVVPLALQSPLDKAMVVPRSEVTNNGSTESDAKKWGSLAPYPWGKNELMICSASCRNQKFS